MNNPVNVKSNSKPLNKKHILFYSNFCQFSNDVCQKIEKYGIKNEFLLINISQKKYKIPSVITLVPTILLNDKKTLVQDEDIDKLLIDLNKNGNGNNQIDAFTQFNGISNVYSFLDDENNKDTTLNFGLIDREFRIETPAEDGEGGVNSGSISDKMNNMQELRNREIQDLFKNNK